MNLLLLTRRFVAFSCVDTDSDSDHEDDELQFQLEDAAESACECSYRFIYNSLRNMGTLLNSTVNAEDADDEADEEDDQVDSYAHVRLDRQILNAEPELELAVVNQGAEEAANRRMRLMQVARELRAISHDFEQRMQLRNVS